MILFNKNSIAKYVVAAATIICTPCVGQNQSLNNTRINYSTSPATQWEDFLVSGNGEVGILVGGDPTNEKVILNHEFLYKFSGTEEVAPPDISNVMPKVKELIKERKYPEALELSFDESRKKGHKESLRTDSYHPAALLRITQDFDGEVSDYMRTTDYNSGEISVTWRAGKVDYNRLFFVSRPDDVIVGKVASSAKRGVNLRIGLTHQIDSKNFPDTIPADSEQEYKVMWENMVKNHIKPTEYKVDKEWLTFRVGYKLYDRGYEVILQVRNDGGKVYVVDDNVIVERANSVELLSKVISVEPFSASEIESAKAQIKELGSYGELSDRNKKELSNILNRVTLHLDKSGFVDGSNEELIAMQKEMGVINPYLLEKMFNMGQYTLASSSGNNPPNLMGIWNGEWNPRWSGDFTLDANVNLQIAGANLLNMPEAIDSYMNMLERIAPDWEVNAKHLHGCRGYVSGIRTAGRRGYSTHFLKFPSHYWTAGASWLIYPCYEYYLCSGDKKFLFERLLPMMEKIALFYEDFLDTYDENGKYLFAPSFSPENRAPMIKHKPIHAVANATMDIAAAKSTLTNLIYICEKENIQHEKLSLWREMLTKFPPYLINEDGALKEWARMDLRDNYNHRHASHLYPVWPCSEITPDDVELYNAAKKALELRGRGGGSAHGFMITALAGARLKDGELVYNNLLGILHDGYIYRSLFTSHNPNNEVYNSDPLHSLPAVVLEALVFSKPGTIELLPALSERLAKGSVEGVLCRTEAKVESMKWDMNIRNVVAKISSNKAQTITVQLRKSVASVLVDGVSVDVYGDRVAINFAKDSTHEIVFNWHSEKAE